MGYRNSVDRWLEFLREKLEKEALEEISGISDPQESPPATSLDNVKETQTVTVDSQEVGSIVIHLK